MTGRTSRRGFIRGAAGLAALGAGGCFSFGRRGPAGKVRIAAVGVGGRGFLDWMPMLESGKAELAALCDCDRRRQDALASNARFCAWAEANGVSLANIPFYSDYRRLLGDADFLGVQALTVATTDHTHAPIAVPAMKAGLHVYVETPLARTLWELDYFNATARECGAVVQMGNQGSALDGFRRGVEVLRSRLLGDVCEVHVWTVRPVWPQGRVCEAGISGPYVDEIPAGLDWNAWLSTAAERPYREGVCHPFNWRGFFDFGGGALGDRACHMMNLPFRGLELGPCAGAELLSAEDAGRVFFPVRSTVRFSFGARTPSDGGDPLPPVDVYWYDGMQAPDADLMPQVVAARLDRLQTGAVPESGCLVVGSRGLLFSSDDYGERNYLALEGEEAVQPVETHPACAGLAQTLPRRLEPGDGHAVEFLDAVRGEGPEFAATRSRCFSGVRAAVPLTETALVGVVAQRLAGEGVANAALNWNSVAQVFDSQAANAFLKPHVRKGFDF